MKRYDQFLELARSRRSVRRFARRPVSRDDLARLFDAARWAPSNHNRQPWRFLVLKDEERIRRLAQAVSEGLTVKLKALPAMASGYVGELAHYATLFTHAPVVILALHKRPISVSAALLEGLPHPTLVSGEPLSVAMAVQNLVLAAKALGLGTCVMTAPLVAQDAVAACLDLPAGFDTTCFVAVGYPGESPEPPRRKSLEQIVEFRNNQEGSGRKHDDGE